MSQWYGTARTNYFHCDLAALAEAIEPFDLRVYEGGDGLVMLSPSEMSDDGGWPSWAQIDAPDPEDAGETIEKEIEFSFEEYVMPYVVEGEVVIAMSAGAEKLRYVSGNALAFCRRGLEVQIVHISLQDIYALSAEKFAVPRESITACEY